MARLASGIWVAALLRRINQAGGFATVLRRGDETAGAIYVQHRGRDGTCSLAGPAPQSDWTEQLGQGRRFEWRLEAQAIDRIDALIAQELRLDGDLWLVEVECDRALLDAVLTSG
ncbi:MAG: DUF1491 family protein [Rhizobiaceae bacterium]|jgi:hypothetical protein|nr:DUF1491 family protein [Rhizobiaceae bacterium]